MPDETQAEGSFGFETAQAGCRIQHTVQLLASGQFAFVDGNAPSDLTQLGPVGQLVFHDDE